MIHLFLALCPQNPVLVAPAPAADGRAPVVSPGLVLLDVDDLVGTAEALPKADERETPEQRKVRATSTFADILRRWMKPPFDLKTDRVDVTGPGQIAVAASQEKTLWTQRFCEVQRKKKSLVYVQTQILDVPRGVLANLGIEGPTKSFDKETDLEAILARLRDGTDTLSAPRLLIPPRAEAQVSVGNPVSYVSDWRMEIVEPGPQSIGVPTVETIFDGIVIRARVVPLEDDVFGLELDFESTKLQRPISTRTMRIGSGEGKQVEIGLPEVRKVGLDTRMTLADGSSVLFQTLSSEEGREIAVAVTLRRASEEDLIEMRR